VQTFPSRREYARRPNKLLIVSNVSTKIKLQMFQQKSSFKCRKKPIFKCSNKKKQVSNVPKTKLQMFHFDESKSKSNLLLFQRFNDSKSQKEKC
jgi:hypothetical protein